MSLEYRGQECPPVVSETGAESTKFVITIDRDEDGVWIVECPAIPGCISQGDTKQQAIENIQDAIKLCLEVRAERGMPPVVSNSAS